MGLSAIAPMAVPAFPVPHRVHTPVPALAAKVPAVQFWHVPIELAPKAAENRPGSQEMQVSLVSPARVRYLPATQFVQAPATAAPEYLPAWHLWQTPIEDPPDDAEKFPAPQARHRVLPGPVLYEPARQVEQEDNPAMVATEPARQLEQALAPAVLTEPAAQVWQVSAIVAPVIAEAFPFAQRVHPVFPNPTAYLPVPHVSQEDAPTKYLALPASQEVQAVAPCKE